MRLKILEGPVPRVSGTRTHILNIANQSKHDIKLFHYSWLSPYSYLFFGRGFLIRRRITIPDPYAIYLKRSYFKRFDILHTHGHPYWWNIYKGHNMQDSVKRIHTVHQIYFKEDAHSKARWKTEDVLNKRLIKVCKKMELVISVSRWLRSELLKMGIESTYIPNGVDTDKCNKVNPEYFRKKRGVEGDFFFFAGNSSKLKRPDYFIRLAKAFPTRKFVMCGIGINRLRVPANVINFGQLSYNETLSAMKACRVFILPSSKEAFGSVLLEAMACKKPVCATNSTGMKEIIQDGKNGYLFKQNNIADLIRKADTAWNDGRIKLSGYRKISEEYDWKHIVKKIDKVYEGICK